MGCVMHDDRVLMVRRYEPRYSELHGYFEFPGGKIHFGENPSTAVEREIFEEAGIKVVAQHLVPFSYVAIRKQKEFHLNVIVWCYRCKYISETTNFTLPQKVAQRVWIPLHQLDPIKIQSGTLQFLLHVIKEENLLPSTKLVETSTEYLMLYSVDLDQNRLRKYNILIEARIDQNSPFRIQCQWGRLGESEFRQTSVEEFRSRDRALSYLNQILSLRQSHDYEIVDRSQNFPPIPVLSKFPIDDKARQQNQLDLF